MRIIIFDCIGMFQFINIIDPKRIWRWFPVFSLVCCCLRRWVCCCWSIPLFMGYCVWSMVCNAVLRVLFSFAIILQSLRKRNLVALFETFCSWETPKRVLLKTVKIQMKCSIMLHFIRVYTGCKDKKYLQTKEYIIILEKLKPDILDMNNGQ